MMGKIDLIAKKKKIKKEVFYGRVLNLLSMITVVPEDVYAPHLPKARSLVNDPKDTPYAALALHLKTTHPKVIILTFNPKDFNTQELQKHNIHVLTPTQL